MQRATTSSERTPLVQPTYVFESSLARSYQKRLRNFQCAICVTIIGVLAIGLLVTVSYNLSTTDDHPVPATPAPAVVASFTDTSTIAANPLTPDVPTPIRNLTLLSPVYQHLSADTVTPANIPSTLLTDNLEPLLKLQWPLKGKPLQPWVGETPSDADISTAIDHGRTALAQRRLLETKRKPLASSEPAFRAQRAAATAASVKPMADAAYAAEMATRALVSRTANLPGSVGEGPPLNHTFYPLRYCLTDTPPCPVSKYRTQDGSCNNLNHPLRWGVSNTPFRRLLPPVYADGISAPRLGTDGAMLPSARDVSVTVHRPSYAHDTAFTVMLAVWGQFTDHDITATALSKGENSTSLSCCDGSQTPHPECFPVPLDVEDPFYQTYNLTCMEFVRSASAPTCHFGAREQLNQASAFIDASTVYGFSEARASKIRSFSGGKLKMLIVGGRELLPPSLDADDGCNTAEMAAKGRYCFESGDDRANENLHLTTMHLVWARQHNRVAGELARRNPAWDDDVIYRETRRILGAQMQHITYNEFLPNVLGVDVMWALNMTLQSTGFSSSYDPTVDPSVANHFSAAAFRFAHTLLPGLIRSADLSTGSINYIQLHEMLFNPYTLYGRNGSQISVNSALITPIHGVDPHVTKELSEHMFETPVVANSTNKKLGPCGLDLVSLNIQRGRDHGLPPYPQWREVCGFPRPTSFEDLQEVFDGPSYARISNIYSNVDDIDLYTGALAEEPNGRLLGPTLTCLIADQFLRLKIADRFWYETDDATVGFTAAQLAEIRKTTLASVICVNEDMLAKAQPRVMETIGADNPLVDCKELPQPDWTPWAGPSPKKKKKKSKNILLMTADNIEYTYTKN